jgi:hypothetical protein
MLGHGGKQRDRDVTVRVRRLRDLDRRRADTISRSQPARLGDQLPVVW